MKSSRVLNSEKYFPGFLISKIEPERPFHLDLVDKIWSEYRRELADRGIATVKATWPLLKARERLFRETNYFVELTHKAGFGKCFVLRERAEAVRQPALPLGVDISEAPVEPADRIVGALAKVETAIRDLSKTISLAAGLTLKSGADYPRRTSGGTGVGS